MRVTNSMFASGALKNLNKNSSEMLKLQEQISSGKKISRPSDSPMIANESEILRSDVERLAHYAKNIDIAQNMAADAETALMDINRSIQNVKELILQASNGTQSLQEREDIITEIEQNKEQIISLLNTASSDKYIFGGYNTKVPPVESDTGTIMYNGTELSSIDDVTADAYKNELVSIRISKGTELNVSMTVLDIVGYGDGNLFQTIDEITGKMSTDTFDPADIETEMGTLENHFNNVLNKCSEMGGKEKRLDMVEDQINETIFGSENLLSEVEDVNIEEAIINYELAKQAYNATLAVSAQNIKMTLLDYLG